MKQQKTDRFIQIVRICLAGIAVIAPCVAMYAAATDNASLLYKAGVAILAGLSGAVFCSLVLRARQSKKNKTARKRTFLTGTLVTVLILCALCFWLVWGDNAVETTHYPVESAFLPAAFDGFRIAQVSDLHNEEMGESNEQLLFLLRQAQPDIIAVTGDVIDCRTPNTEISLDFLEEALKIAPVYYVTGNHEGALYQLYPSFERAMTDLGVQVLHNEAIVLTRNGSEILLVGLDDPNTANSIGSERISLLQDWSETHFTLVLSHRPELFEEYCMGNADLVLTGHAHGGQFRFPIIGGLYAPGQGLLPQYDAGMFESGRTRMLVSRGIGNSLFPLRVNNRPELAIIELKTTAIG